MDPRRRRSRAAPASTPSASAASTPTRCWRSSTEGPPPTTGRRGRASCVVLESDSQAGLAAEADRLACVAWTERAHARLTDLAFTLSRALGRAERPLRLAIVASSVDDLRAKLGQATEKLALAELQADQGGLGHLLRGRAARSRRQGRLRLPGRGRAVPEHAGRPLPALPRGARGVRSDRPALRRASARLRPERLGLPAPGLLGGRARSAPRSG